MHAYYLLICLSGIQKMIQSYGKAIATIMSRGYIYEIKRGVTDPIFCSKYETVPSAKSLCSLWLKKCIKKAMNCFMASGDKWTRTIDSRIFSPMLYQLSYITLFVK